MSYSLSTIVSHIKKQYPGASVASDIKDPNDFISTGNKAVDLMLGGGIAFGYMVEWAGLSQSGKTLMLQMMLANAQREYDAIGLWIDRENALTNERCAQLNINTEQLIIAKPWDVPTVKDAEGFLVDALSTIRKKYKDCYIFGAIDSVSSFGKNQDGEDMGKKAKQLHSLFRQILPLMDTKTSFHMANQITFSPGVLFGDNRVTTGGEGPKYYSTYRLFLSNRYPIVDENKGKEVIGNWIQFDVVKTRRGPSHRRVNIPFLYESGISDLGGYIRLLAQRGYVRPKNKKEFSSFKQKTVVLGDRQYSEDDPEKLLLEHPELNFKDWPDYNSVEEDKEEQEDLLQQ